MHFSRRFREETSGSMGSGTAAGSAADWLNKKPNAYGTILRYLPLIPLFSRPNENFCLCFPYLVVILYRISKQLLTDLFSIALMSHSTRAFVVQVGL